MEQKEQDFTKEEIEIQDALGTLKITSITIKSNEPSRPTITVIGNDPDDVIAKYKKVCSSL